MEQKIHHDRHTAQNAKMQKKNDIAAERMKEKRDANGKNCIMFFFCFLLFHAFSLISSSWKSMSVAVAVVTLKIQPPNEKQYRPRIRPKLSLFHFSLSNALSRRLSLWYFDRCNREISCESHFRVEEQTCSVINWKKIQWNKCKREREIESGGVGGNE